MSAKRLIREQIISGAIKNLKDFGYPCVDKDNIFTDSVYSLAFKSMLRDNQGHNKVIDEIINEILSEVK